MPDVRPPSRGIVPAQRLVPNRKTSPAATPAARSTEERASARPSFRHSRFSGRRSPRARSFSCLRSGSPRVALSRVSHTSHPSGFPQPTVLSRALRASLRPWGVSAIASVVPAFPSPGLSSRFRPRARSIDPEGFRSCRPSRVQAVLAPHSHTPRRSNPGVQWTRFARH